MLGRNDATEVGTTVDDIETDVVVTDEDAKSWPPVMETKDAGFETGNDVEVKDASADLAVNIEETDDPFRFRIIGGVTGIVDRVNDVVEPGAYTKTLRARTPKIIKDHEWSQRLGKVLSIKELRPGDPGLPKTTASGEAWPREAGALIADVQLFKKSQAGQEAAERWREYGRDQQFSIGYRVPAGMATKSANGVRRIKELDLYEISDVLWGAAPDSTLLPTSMSVKILQGDLEVKDADVEVDEDEDEVSVEETDTDEAVAPNGGAVEDDTESGEDEEASDEDEESDDDVEAEEDEEINRTLEEMTDEELDAIEPEELNDEDHDVEAFDAFGDEVASFLPDSDIDRGDAEETRAPSTSDAGEHTADTLHDPHPGSGDAPDNAAAARVVVDGNVGPRDGEPENAAPSTSDAGKAMGAIESHVDLRAALREWEAAPEAEKVAYAPYIVSSAEDARIGYLVPDDVRDYAAKYDTSPVGTPGGRQNWVDKAGGLPKFVRAVAHALIRNGTDKSRAIALAVGSMKRWAGGGGNVSAKTRAKAVAALAEWNAKRVKGRAKSDDVSTSEYETQVEEVTGTADRKSIDVPFFAGSNEEIRALVQAALTDSRKSGEFEGRPNIVGMWDSYCIVSVYPDDETPDLDTPYVPTAYKVDFTYDADAGTVELGQIQMVRVNASGTDGPTASDEDVEDAVEAIVEDDGPMVESVKTSVALLDLEGKAGRVLSSASAEDLKVAYQSLGKLLARAGVDVNPTDSAGDEDVVTDETDVAEKALPDEDARMLELMRIETEVRARALRL